MVEYTKNERIAYITLNRPEAKNAIDPSTHDKLWEIWRDFESDVNLDVAIITGKGDAFCAGADLKSYMSRWPNATAEKVRSNITDGLGGLTRGLHRLKKPTIAAVNGWALAGGFETALACDIRIASEKAMFGSFEARRGFHHGDGGIPRLVNSAGLSVAMQMLLTAEPINAQKALQWNLVSEVVAHENLMNQAELIARQILRNDQVAVRSAKETILDMIGRNLDDHAANGGLEPNLSDAAKAPDGNKGAETGPLLQLPMKRVALQIAAVYEQLTSPIAIKMSNDRKLQISREPFLPDWNRYGRDTPLFF